MPTIRNDLRLLMTVLSHSQILMRECRNIADDNLESGADPPAYVREWETLPPRLARLLTRVRSLVCHALAYADPDSPLSNPSNEEAGVPNMDNAESNFNEQPDWNARSGSNVNVVHQWLAGQFGGSVRGDG